MAGQLVVADASPLIGLAMAGEFHLLRALFGEIRVTEAVRDEVLGGGDLPGSRELGEAISAGWAVVVNAPLDATAFPGLGAGEASTLGFALSQPVACLLLLDDLSARAHARANGIAHTGLAGVIVAAKKEGLLGSVRPSLERLKARKFRLSRQVLSAVLEEAGEH